MKRKVFIISLFLFLIFLISIPMILQNHKEKRQSKACFRNHCFYIELAATPRARATGLMFRNRLRGRNGMLFVFEKEGIYPFWMKNTLIPLDIIWLDRDGKVVFIKEDAQPCTNHICPKINPNKKAKYVLEVNSGIIKQIGLSVGDKMKIEY